MMAGWFFWGPVPDQVNRTLSRKCLTAGLPFRLVIQLPKQLYENKPFSNEHNPESKPVPGLDARPEKSHTEGRRTGKKR